MSLGIGALVGVHHATLDITGASTTAGTQADQWAPNDSAARKFKLVPRSGGGGSAGAGALKGVESGRCADVPGFNQTSGRGTADRTAVIIWDCTGGTNQQWNVNSDGTIVGVQSGKCLDATDHGTANGTKLELWTCNGGANQKWART